MHRVDIRTRFILLLLFGLAAELAFAENPTVTKHRVFSIPFFISDPAVAPSEVLLYVSGDRGKTWKLYQRRSANAGKFDFRAGEDGEFWFVVGTDRNPIVPQEGTSPDKRVIVDNEQPEVELKLDTSSNGRMRATWWCADPTLNARSFQLQYRTSSSPAWKSLDVVRPQHSQDGFDGEVSWIVADQEGMVDVTALIEDEAGNEASLTRSLPLSSAPVHVKRDNQIARQSTTSFASNRTRKHTKPHEGREELGIWTSEENAFDSSPLPWRNPLSSKEDSDQLDPSIPLASFVERDTSPDLPDPMGMQANTRHREPLQDGNVKEPREDDAILFSNSRQFNLEYDIADLDGELERVELWITEDKGNHWEPYGLDEDLLSPVLVEVEAEGRYGFRMLLHAKNGRSNRPPQNSDPPDVTIEVDTTRPQAAIRSAEYQAGPSGNRLVVDWDAHDRNLAKGSIILSYSKTVEGPWVIFAREVENVGHHEWRPNVKLPKSFYVQLDTQDKAGNRTVHRFPKAISLKSIAPKARVRFLQVVPQ